MAAATDGSGSARAAAAAASTSPRTASNGCGLTGKPPGSPASSAAAAEPGSAATSSAGLPASVSHFYYKHGLLKRNPPLCE